MTPPAPGGGNGSWPQQLRHLGLVIGVIVAAVIVVRFVVIPRSYLSTEIHESATVERELAKPIRFAGMTTCVECHSDVDEVKARSFHKGLSCEVCHGPSAKHAEDPENVKPPAPRDRKFCPVCHAYDPSRPTGFPQINPVTHNPGSPCIACHNPHDPVPPETPRECSACHAQIEHTKSLSAHSQLPCTTCHVATEQHRLSPRTALPSKPESREFCGQCHGTDSTNPQAPKVSLSEHGGRYLCWQCHYPHLPEGSR